METLQISGAKARQMWLCGTPPPPAATECGGKVDVGGAELTMRGQRDGGGAHGRGPETRRCQGGLGLSVEPPAQPWTSRLSSRTDVRR